jgi:hypothetical protein
MYFQVSILQLVRIYSKLFRLIFNFKRPVLNDFTRHHLLWVENGFMNCFFICRTPQQLEFLWLTMSLLTTTAAHCIRFQKTKLIVTLQSVMELL